MPCSDKCSHVSVLDRESHRHGSVRRRSLTISNAGLPVQRDNYAEIVRGDQVAGVEHRVHQLAIPVDELVLSGGELISRGSNEKPTTSTAAVAAAGPGLADPVCNVAAMRHNGPARSDITMGPRDLRRSANGTSRFSVIKASKYDRHTLIKYDERSPTEERTVAFQSSMPTRGRSLAATLFGVLAVLASLFVGPGAAGVQAGAVPAATAPITRSVAPLGFGKREINDELALPRVAARDQARLAVDLARPMTVGQHPTLSDAVLPAAVLVLALIAWFLAARDRTGRVLRRRLGTRRDRAPPTLSLA